VSVTLRLAPSDGDARRLGDAAEGIEVRRRLPICPDGDP